MDAQSAAGHDYVKRRASQDHFGSPLPDRFTFLEAWRVKHLQVQGISDEGIAKEFSLDLKDLRAWIEANKEVLAAINSA